MRASGGDRAYGECLLTCPLLPFVGANRNVSSTSIRDVQLLGTKVTRRVELMRLKFVSGTVAPGAEICGNTRAQIRGDYVDAEGAIVFAKGVRDGPRRHRLGASRRFLLLERPGQELGQGQEPRISETMRRGSTPSLRSFANASTRRAKSGLPIRSAHAVTTDRPARRR